MKKHLQFMYVIANSARMASVSGPVHRELLKKLTASFQPIHLEVINESQQHNVPIGSETHFKVVVVSSAFQDLPLLKRHRLVNATLENELNSGVHALSIVAKTPDQWSASDVVESSPQCRGGFGK